MKYTTLLLGLLARGTTSRAAELPVCIIGAGPTGLRAAHELEARGRDVVVLDERAAAGGKSQAYYEPGRPQFFAPLGALLLENTTYVEGRAVIARTNLTYLPAPHLQPTWSFDWATGTTLPFPQLPADQRAPLAAEVKRYGELWKEKFEPVGAVGYRNDIPHELTVPAAEWLAKNNFKLMPIVFNEAMFAYGYGDLDETPIWYMLQYFTPTIVAAFTGSQTTPLNAIDFHGVLAQYAAQLRRGVLLRSRVTDIWRPADGQGPVTLRYLLDYGRGLPGFYSQDCAQLVLAFPPTLRNLQKAGLALTQEEADLFAAVRTNNYFSGAVSMAIPAGQLWYANSSSPAEPPADARGQPMGLMRLFPEVDLVATWSWSRDPATTPEEARRLLVETLGRLNRRDPADANTVEAFGNDSVHNFVQNDYFPHVSGRDLAGGFYAKLDQLQGTNNTFYASGLNGYETVEFALRAGKDIVEHYMS